MKKLFYFSLLLPLASFSQRVITVGGAKATMPGFTNQAIQRAVDALPAEGGTVQLDAGEYSMMAPVRLRSNTNLVGVGNATLLKRIDGFRSKFIIDADYGEKKVVVENVKGFKPGMSIQVSNKPNWECWDVSVANITHIAGDTLFFDNYLIRDYDAEQGGMVTNAGSCISVYDAENVSISHLAIDGNKEKNDPLDGCNGGGIVIIKSKKVTVDKVQVRNFNGEGITWQITDQVTVKNSEISGCSNMGLHPGSGSPNSVIENNASFNNKVGLFICWRVQHSLVKNNRFYGNSENGISTGHKDSDVTFEGNHIYENGQDGVYFREEDHKNSPHRNLFVNNLVEKNRGYGFYISGKAMDVQLKGNTIRDNKAAIFIAENTVPITSVNNTMTGNIVYEKMERTPIELMKLIVEHQLNDIELKDGFYPKGNWEAVKKSKLPVAMYWSYPTGVTLLGMQRVYAINKDERIMQFVNKNNAISADQYAYLRWQKNTFGAVYNSDNFEKLWRLDMLDDCGAMGAAILEAGLRHKAKFSPALQDMVNIIGNYVTNVQYRLKQGTFWRPGSPEGPTIWADDLYMSLPFLVRWSEYKKDTSALNDAVRQIIDYAGYLQTADGVWLHAYFVEKNEASCCKWGRANGWVAVAMAEVLSVLPVTHPDYKKVLGIYKRQIDGLVKYQSPSGLWNQVIDHPELSWGTETSCSAQFTYAIARGINRGWLDASYRPVVEKAMRGLDQQINNNGSINKVCMSTSIGNDLEYYNNRSSKDDDYHGVGLMLLALTEAHTLFQNK